jgi:hypothetical protein
MNKEFVPYTESLALKELGFNEPCFSIYYSKDKSFSWHHHKDHTNDEPALESGEFNISAPTFSQAFRWLFQKLGIEKGVMPLDIESQQLSLKELIEIVKQTK